MAIWVKIRKMLHKNDTVYYKVYAQDYTTIECYMGIERDKKIINFYLNTDFSSPIKIIDCSIKNIPIGSVKEISHLSYTKALNQGLKVLYNDNTFPEIIDFEA